MLPFNPSVILFVGFELCYYLLIAQTGIVEVYHSDIMAISPLPIGGVMGSVLSSHINLKNEHKVTTLITLQMVMTFFYPHMSVLTLFVLGLSVGGMAPLIIEELKGKSVYDLLLALCFAYATGTLLFTTDPNYRDIIGVVMSAGAMLSYFVLRAFPSNATSKGFGIEKIGKYSLLSMCFWVFLDSALFETLSRDISIPIWRGGFTFEIITFHILGVISGIFSKANEYQRSVIILVLFVLSYLFYFLHEAWILSIVYPFVISYYNVAILQSLANNLDLKKIGIYMVFIGWAASGVGLLVALEQWIIYIPICFVAVFIYLINQKTTYQISKEAYHA